MGSKKLTKIWIVFLAFLLVFSMNSFAFAAIQTTHVVKSGDTLYGISRQYNVPVETLKELNNLNNSVISVGQTLKLTKNIIYIVKAGDTLFGISQKYSVSADAIKKENNMTTTTVKVGQELVIPVGSTGSVTNPDETTVQVQTVYASVGGAKAYKTTSKTSGYHKTYPVGYKLKVIYYNSNWFYSNVLDANGKLVRAYFHKDEVQTISPTATVKTITVYASVGGTKAYKTASKTSGYHKIYPAEYKLKVVDYGSSWHYSNVLDANGKLVRAYFHEDEFQDAPPTTGTETKTITTAVVNVSGSLNVRSGAGTSYGIIDSLTGGTKVEIVKESGTWANVKYGTKSGWVSQDYLINKTTTTVPVTDPTPTEPTVKKATVQVAGGLNVRQGAGTNYGIVGLLSNGTVIDVIKESGTWAYIEYGNLKGWVSKEYIVYGVQPENPTVPSGTLKGKIIVLDPGHGGNDSGAVGIDGSTYEKTLALNYAKSVKTQLEAYGATVYMTRTTDTRCGGVYAADSNTDLKCRTDYAKNKGADIFISVHFNSGYGATGTETYYNETDSYDGNVNPYPNESKLLAESVHKYYRPAVNLPDRGVRNANFYVNRMADMPSVLLEVGFMSSYTDLNRVKSSSVQDAFAKGVAKGINEYFSKIDN